MRHLLACLAILAAFNVGAQTETSNFPYNPDSDGDGFVGVADILELLNSFGQAFQVQITLNSDSTSAIYFPPSGSTLAFLYTWHTNCVALCDSLPGPWRIMSSMGFAQHLSVIQDSIDIGGSSTFWTLDLDSRIADFTENSVQLPMTRIYSNSSEGAYDSANRAFPETTSYGVISACLCELRQRPRVEYTQCVGGLENVLDCVEEKTQQGWYPLDLIPFGSNSVLQTMWRWED